MRVRFTSTRMDLEPEVHKLEVEIGSRVYERKLMVNTGQYGIVQRYPMRAYKESLINGILSDIRKEIEMELGA